MGTLEDGEIDLWEFTATAGASLTFSLAADRVGSGADVDMRILDTSATELVSAESTETSTDPFLTGYTFSSGGTYYLELTGTTGDPEAPMAFYYFGMTLL